MPGSTRSRPIFAVLITPHATFFIDAPRGAGRNASRERAWRRRDRRRQAPP
jgi:hypothetical protein